MASETERPDYASTEPITDDAGEWVHVEDLDVERGDVVKVRWLAHSGGADEEPGEEVTFTGEVRSVFRDGGINLRAERDHQRDAHRKLHAVPGGTVTGNAPYSSRTKRYGVRARARKVD